MYESPIETIYENVQAQFEDAVLKAVQKAGINIDKEELIKALHYDRNQYNYGYSDGWKAREDNIVRCKDCKYHEDEEPGMVYCQHIVGGWVSDESFCSRGERIEDAESN